MIVILSGTVRSGKTTTLQQWSSGRSDCGGVLSPDVKGLRRLQNVLDKTSIAWQKEKLDADSDLQIGRFVFDRLAFREAQHWLDDHLSDPMIQHIILDEIGPLELSGQGWDDWLRSALQRYSEKTFILVVRESLTPDVIQSYGIQNAQVVSCAFFIPH